MADEDTAHHIELTADIVAAYVSNNTVEASKLGEIIASVHAALGGAGTPVAEAAPLTPAVPIKKSITPDFLISLEDGRKYKSLKRHLNTRGMSPDEYRTKWGLPKDYPMVAASYSAQRSALAHSLGLGRGGRGGAPKPAPAPTKGGRRKASA